jgi:antitoxin HigA-1
MSKLSPLHPGEHLKEYLEELGLSAYQLASSIGVQQTRISQILKAQRGISADTALRLGRYFGTSAQFWINLQSHYELELSHRMFQDMM